MSSAAVPESGVVIVPRTPGPLLDPDAAVATRPHDEIDAAIDELFGPDPGGSVGKTDAVLIVAGGGLFLWSLLGLHSPVVTILGGLLLVLGLTLPLRSLWRRTSAWRVRRRRSAVTSRGIALTVEHPLTRELALAYERLLAAVDQPDAPLASEAVNAAHLALTESATLVGAAGPANAAETEYVERRVEAIRELAAELERHALRAHEGQVDEAERERTLERAARAAAGEELDASGLSSLRELDELKQALAADPDD